MRHAFERLLHLSSVERALLLRAGLLVAVVRVTLWVVPWPGALRPISVLPSVRPLRRVREFSTERLAWAIERASRFVPAATCLTQSLALQCLLTAAGRSSTVEIGVMKVPGSALRAHAWVETDGDMLLSTAGEVASYARVLTLPATSRP